LATRGYKTIQTIHDYKPVCPLTTMVIEKDNYAICAGKNKIKCYKKRCLKLQTNLFDFFIFDNNFWQKKYINEFICPSKLLMSKLKEYDYNNLIYLPNPIETLKEQETNIKSNNILFVGRLIKEKGVKYLIDGFKIAISKNNNLRLIIVGTGPEKDYLEKYCKDLNIEEFINFAGNIEPNKIDTYYKNSLAVIIPSILMEQFGLTALEGMKNGRPIIAFNIGGLTELIENGRNGFLINRFDSQKLAEKIILLSNDRYLAEKMGQVGLEKMKKYEIKNYSNEMIKIYQSN
jgi:glycosyltransferase involved in cell wall biosynthesis